MESKTEELRRRIAQQEMDLRRSRESLDYAERSCQHTWDNPVGVYNPIEHKGYRYEGDPVGTMGVDWRPGGYVSARTEDRWTRTCQKCGKVEHTSQGTEKVVKTGGNFGDQRRY